MTKRKPTGQLVDDRKTKRVYDEETDTETVEFKVVAEGTAEELYDKLADLGDDAAHHSIQGLDHTELPDKEPGKHRSKKK